MSGIKWIKLATDMFNDEKIKLIRTMPEGDSIILVWVQLLLMAGKVNDGGLVYVGQNLYYSDEMLATICDQPLNIMRLAIQTLEQFGLIERDDNELISIVNWEKHQSTDKMARIKEQTRIRQQKFYYRNKLRELGVNVDEKGFTDDLEELKKLYEELEEPNVRLTLANDTEVRSKKKEVRSKKKEVNKSRKFTFDDTHMKLANLLWSHVKKNFPNTKEPNLESWANDIRLMMERDNRTIAEIKGVIEWSQNHDFWYANIRSTSKLREKYEDMYAQADRENKKKPKKQDFSDPNRYVPKELIGKENEDGAHRKGNREVQEGPGEENELKGFI